MNINYLNKKTGFTLIHLLTAIAIISVLSAIVIGNLSMTSPHTRDTHRIAELRNLQIGLELYKSKHGVYPCGGSNKGPLGTKDGSLSCPIDPYAHTEGFLNGCIDIDSDPNCEDVTSCNASIGPKFGLYTDGILPTNCATDPLNKTVNGNQYQYRYYVRNNRIEYVLATYLEAKQDLMLNDGGLCDDAYEIGNAVGKYLPSNDRLGPPSGC